MDDRQHKKFKKDIKAHTGVKCWKCLYPKEGSCKQNRSSCTAIHCACAMVDPRIKD